MTAWTRRLLLLNSVLALIAGTDLFFASEETADMFAWTIEPPLTAAFLGGTYLSAVLFLFLCSRRSEWASARIGAISAQVLIALILAAMLIHIDRFHTDDSDPLTFFATWSFIGTYVFVPPAVFIGLVHQLRVPGVDPPRRSRLPAWFRITLGVHAPTMLIVGAALVVVPATADAVWPWALTELTGRAVGAFSFATGLVAAIALFEDDWERILAAVTIYPVLGVLELIVLVRYHSELNWASPTSWVYLAFLLSVLLAGFAAWITARRTPLNPRSRQARND